MKVKKLAGKYFPDIHAKKGQQERALSSDMPHVSLVYYVGPSPGRPSSPTSPSPRPRPSPVFLVWMHWVSATITPC